jgi:type I restriction enzyme M protein
MPRACSGVAGHRTILEPEHALEIQGWFEKFEDVQDAVRIVGIDEIKAEDWTLNISRYVLPPLQEDIPHYPRPLPPSRMH